MLRTKTDILCTTLFAVLGILLIILCLVGAVVGIARHGGQTAPEEPATLTGETAVVLPDMQTINGDGQGRPPLRQDEEDPDETQKSLQAILDKCQVVEDGYIVAYAPELVAGWRPEYRNGSGMYMTASGCWAAPGCTVATDPAVIPTGATVIIDGQLYVAADRGVSGKVVDVMVTPAEALTYGCRRADVYWCMEGEATG